MSRETIVIKGAREHNLKGVDLEIPRNRLIVITGVSGSGKSSLAFDTIYAEGQRRYVESLSAYARQFLELMEKPDVDSIEGLSPAISIEQKSVSKNPRSTVGTVTEIYDYLRLLFASVGVVVCPGCEREIRSQTVQDMTDSVLSFGDGGRVVVLAPIVRGRKGEYRKEFERLRKEGFVRVRVDGEMRDLSEEIVLDRKKKHDIDVVVDRLVLKEGIRNRLAEAFELALRMAGGVAKVLDEFGREHYFSERFACPECNFSIPEVSPRLFSFNNPYGACPSCAGLGTANHFDPDLVIPDRKKSLREGAIAPWERRGSTYFFSLLDALADHYDFSLYTPFEELPKKIQDVILYGSGDEEIRFYYLEGSRKYYYYKPFEGVIPYLERRYRETESEFVREELEKYIRQVPCPECRGARLRREALHVRVGGKNIHEVTCLSVRDALSFFQNLVLSRREEQIASRVLKEIVSRLGFLKNVGLDYLTLDRPSSTLSGGEGQRIRLATQIGASLVGVMYILDEPSIGLHQRDNRKLLDTLLALRDQGNTVIVVEHDEETIRSADFIVDMGPGAGESGGEVVVAGTLDDVCACSRSLTGQYLSGKKRIEVPEKRRKGTGKHLVLRGCRGNNLKGIDVSIPLGTITCITGVSGSGKSTLLIDTLRPAVAGILHGSREKPLPFDAIEGVEEIDKVVNIDQSPIGRTPRSNPATYTGVFTHIRDLFAKLPESRARGYKPGRFSFNVKGGRCEACQGEGYLKIEMHFMPDVYVTCDVCGGSRFNRETLEVTYRGKSIADVLNMTVNQAYEFFQNIPPIEAKLRTLKEVGLGYIKLGQSATTLSGGEAQRVKLSRELSRRATGKTLYLLDEPTTGLHFDDIRKLLRVLSLLADKGNTVVVIEHNLDVIKCADYVIDLGPEGGDEGGYVVAEGTPEEVARTPGSYTGQFLRKVLPGAGQRAATGR
ncbi:MAG: excinuclease ABC subunit UvrA [Deltaproteobacteria bacterium]|nr:MAG: excinuclease ABC subunit UvrA [Deltaproteobacteria bacterium]